MYEKKGGDYDPGERFRCLEFPFTISVHKRVLLLLHTISAGEHCFAASSSGGIILRIVLGDGVSVTELRA